MGITGALAVEDLLTVANSYHGPEAREPGTDDGSTSLAAHDHLDSAPAAIDFFQRHGIRLSERPQPRHLAVLKEIRLAARMLATNYRAYERRTGRLLIDARFRLDANGRLLAVRPGWDGFVDGLLIGLVEISEDAERLKLCDNDQCRWLFLDRSKNRSRQWCESASCGNRQRVRRFRRRAA